jgi:cell division septal protein FtsQ
MIRRPGSRQAPAARPTRPYALRPGARPGGGIRRTRSVRRASAGLTPVRAGALLAALAGAAAVYGLASSDAFTAQRTTVTGATWTSEARVLDALAIPDGTNIFTIRTGDLERALVQIPAISRATVSIALPDEVRVGVTERQALLQWRIGARRFLVDGEGRLFAELGAADLEGVADLPVVDDGRLSSMVLDVGSNVDPITLDAALRLGSLRPADVGSGARKLVLRLDDQNGFTMRTQPASWTGIFGFYTPTLRTTALIPGQVRLLRSLLAGREDSVQRVILADDHSGTYVPKESPDPTSSAKPTNTPRPAKTPKPAKTPRPGKTPRPAATEAPTESKAP